MALINGAAKESMIVVMGATGVGKSYFLNKLSADSVEEGAGLHSSTLSNIHTLPFFDCPR